MRNRALKNRAIGLIERPLTKMYGFLASLPFRLRADEISPPANVSHSEWRKWLEDNFNKEGLRILEIGSRNVTGTNLRSRFAKATYVGFDFLAGENVDVVGDAHKLTRYFQGQEKFDLILSSAVLEHLHMPWVAAIEIQKMLKVGGYVFIETHFSYSSHERPWHFFQFSEMGLRALFNDSLGFDLVDRGMSNPICGYFSHRADRYLRYLTVPELYCHSQILCRKRCEVESFDWSQVDIDGIVEGTRYPAPKAEAAGAAPRQNL